MCGLKAVATAVLRSSNSRARSVLARMPSTHLIRSADIDSRRMRDEWSAFHAMTGIMTLSSSCPASHAIATVVSIACEAGQLELNVMMPVIAWNALHSSRILRESMSALRIRCVDGILANTERARELLDRSTAVATALSPHIG